MGFEGSKRWIEKNGLYSDYLWEVIENKTQFETEFLETQNKE